MSSLLFNVGMHLEARRIRESASRRYLGDISAASSMRALEHAVFANRLPVLRERQSAGQCYARRDLADIGASKVTITTSQQKAHARSI